MKDKVQIYEFSKKPFPCFRALRNTNKGGVMGALFLSSPTGINSTD